MSALPSSQVLVAEQAEAPVLTSLENGLSVAIVVQNLPVPFDRRVWLECQTLRQAGYQVAVICPKAPGDPPRQRIDGIDLYKYTPRGGGNGTASFFVEYLSAFAATAWLSARAWRDRHFQVLQACNPPDIFWPIALAFRVLCGVRFVFDHHDLCPELFDSRFKKRSRLLRSGLRWLERRTFRSADHVISTNESYRQIALERGGKAADAVTVVRTGPDPRRLVRVAEDTDLLQGRDHLVVYLGVMGPQDGVDLALLCAREIIHGRGRRDTTFVFVGSGDCFFDLVAMRDDLQLQEFVTFTGRVDDAMVATIFSTADVGLCPDPKNALNDLSTMNKTMEYMTYGLPVVAFDLKETRVSAGNAGLYAEPNDVADFATKLEDLLDHPQMRREMGQLGRRRVIDSLAWSGQAPHYLSVFDAMTGRVRAAAVSEAGS